MEDIRVCINVLFTVVEEVEVALPHVGNDLSMVGGWWCSRRGVVTLPHEKQRIGMIIAPNVKEIGGDPTPSNR